jgi:hypothetical protein
VGRYSPVVDALHIAGYDHYIPAADALHIAGYDHRTLAADARQEDREMCCGRVRSSADTVPVEEHRSLAAKVGRRGRGKAERMGSKR